MTTIEEANRVYDESTAADRAVFEAAVIAARLPYQTKALTTARSEAEAEASARFAATVAAARKVYDESLGQA